jgi:cytochrome P450
VKTVLVDRAADVRKGYSTRLMRPVLGNGLLLNEGGSWRARRRTIQPELRRERVEAWTGVIRRWTALILSRWSDNAVREVYADMGALTMGVAGEIVFGIDALSDDGLARALRAAVRATTEGLPFRVVPAMRLIPTPRNLAEARILRDLDREVRALIARRRGGDPGRDLLGALLRCDGPDSDRQLRDDLVTLFFGAYDTTSNALAWALYLVASHPRVAEVLAAETGTARPYAEAVIDETLRLYPSGWAESREALRDFDLGPHRIARGTTIVVSQWVAHRDPRYYEQPEEFRPERWVDGLADRLPPGAFFPFGIGPRRCVGAALAMVESVMVLAAVTAEWELSPAGPRAPRPEAIFTLRPKGGVPLRVLRRSSATPASGPPR